MRFRDGWSVWAWRGVRVPQAVIERADEITPDSIDAETNQEVRRVMIERYGYGRYMSRAKVVHEDAAGKLRKHRNKHGDNIAVVEVLNGSLEPDGTRKTYVLSVPPQMITATEAVAWTYGLTAEQYTKLAVRT